MIHLYIASTIFFFVLCITNDKIVMGLLQNQHILRSALRLPFETVPTKRIVAVNTASHHSFRMFQSIKPTEDFITGLASTNDKDAIIRPAIVSDSELILTFIKELARYEELEDQVVATADSIRSSLFCENAKAEVFILEVCGEAAGFALYFYNYSTFLGKYGIYIEDLYVREQFRGKGYGKLLLRSICRTAIEKDCGRVEWWCLDWNRRAIDFYLSLGAQPMSEWTVFRLTKGEIDKIAAL